MMPNIKSPFNLGNKPGLISYLLMKRFESEPDILKSIIQW